MLSDMGHEVVVEDDGEKAVELFRRDPERFDLIISDLMMLGMTGDEMSEKIHLIRADVPIVVITGTPGNITRHRTEGAGICRVLQKPLTKTELHQALREISHLTPVA